MTKTLYQPVPLDSINDNCKIIRNSNDRLNTMIDFCKDRYGKSISKKSILDVGCCYGYFLNGFSKLSNNIKGIENGKNPLRVCQIFYPNIAKNVVKEDFTQTIEQYEKYDIVLFLSTIHAIIISEGLEYATEILQKIDKVTADILFFDMGQENESIYEYSLEGWNPESISEWILSSTTFDVCEPLMQDSDEGFNRTLFVCYRNAEI